LAFHGAALGGPRTSGGGAALPLRASGSYGPIVGPTECTRPGNGRLLRWIRRAATGPRPRFGGPPTWLRHAAHIPGVLAWSNPPGGNRFFACKRHFRIANEFLASYSISA